MYLRASRVRAKSRIEVVILLLLSASKYSMTAGSSDEKHEKAFLDKSKAPFHLEICKSFENHMSGAMQSSSIMMTTDPEHICQARRDEATCPGT